MSEPKRRVGVKQVRGPFLRLDPHPDACTDEDEFVSWASEWRSRHKGALLGADLFSGAGGLSLGLHQAGIEVVLAVDHDPEAIETHRHQFPGLSVDWDMGDAAEIEKVARLMREGGIEVLAGGPPCQPFSKAGRSKIRDRVRQGLRDPHDQRRDLWRSFFEVVRLAEPRAVIMENVPDMVLDDEMFILRSAVLELEQLGYAVEEKVVESRRFGIPQYRQRMILVAVKRPHRFIWPIESPQKVSFGLATSDLPEVDGGYRPPGGAEGWQKYSGPRTSFQRLMRQGVVEAQQDRIYDHITRPVREDDALAFELMDSETKYSDLPDEFKRYRDDIFDDKYKRLDASKPSRTITAHIAKDGYWYIHPEQGRTITIREAARIQTFPDWYRFAGPPSAAFRQIGNAVPPLLGRVIGQAVVEALTCARVYVASETIGERLDAWFKQCDELKVPWLRAATRWQVICAELLLDRAASSSVRSLWPLLERWKAPEDTISGRYDLTMMGEWIQRPGRADEIGRLAALLVDQGHSTLDDSTLDGLVAAKLVTAAHADIARLIIGPPEGSAEERVIINKGVLRVAAHFTGEAVNARNRLTDGRVAVARMIGYGHSSRSAHLALMEISNSLCHPTGPECDKCPLSAWCRTGAARTAPSA